MRRKANVPTRWNLPPLRLFSSQAVQLVDRGGVQRSSGIFKEIVNSLKKTCQDCRLQADDNRDPGRNGLLLTGCRSPRRNWGQQSERIRRAR